MQQRILLVAVGVVVLVALAGAASVVSAADENATDGVEMPAWSEDMGEWMGHGDGAPGTHHADGERGAHHADGERGAHMQHDVGNETRHHADGERGGYC
ncbi:hypothetical protein [Halorubrum vacuolatum]|nr:hypothetical protein [Halorubrum vacuolatum]